MPQQATVSVENNFTKGLITESTGLNFPENAATDCDNCLFTLVGDVQRREGVDFEDHFLTDSINKTGCAIATYKWNNAGGNGSTQIVVRQIGPWLYFYLSSNATALSPVSAQLINSQVNVALFAPIGATMDYSQECQFSDGNGYLFVFHPSCDPFYVTYNNGVVTSQIIPVQIRDQSGLKDGLASTDRIATLSNEHQYNLINQGWTSGSNWSATSSTGVFCQTGGALFTIATGLTGINTGDTIKFTNAADAAPGGIFQPAGSYVMSGTVTSYTSGSGALAVNIYTVSGYWVGSSYNNWNIIPSTLGKIGTWKSAIGNYPANADVWWYYKNTSNVFDPATTVANVTLNSSNAPKGHIIMNAFAQQRSLLSIVPGLTDITTNTRPSNGCWFQGRVWYAGVNASQAATGDTGFYNWTENIYFSQVNIGTDTNFGLCYQTNDPTSDTLFDLLPTDGGVIQIQGSGPVYRLFPIQNGLLVFAANGVWFITGSQGIGFTANDYTVTKLSKVESISSTSFIDVMGLPYFWNEEGIYSVQPQQGGSLSVEPITVGTILSFYDAIPKQSKLYARGAYHPIDYTIQWIYKSTPDVSVDDRYMYDKILNFNTYNKSFYPYTVDKDTTSINSIIYLQSPGGSNATNPAFKYLCSTPGIAPLSTFTFAEEKDTAYTDWNATTTNGINYTSYFITGYKLRGMAIKKFQPQYVQMYLRTNDSSSAYTIQGIWDFASNRNSNKWSVVQRVNTTQSLFSTTFKRHKIRGHGYALQIKVSSVDGVPFDIQGWAISDTVNASV